jgi:hypothetical protein
MMASQPGKPSFPHFGEQYEGRAMRDFVRILEQFLDRIHPHGPIIIGGGQKIDKYFSASVTWDPPNVNAGGQTTQNVTVTGVALADADPVTVGFSLDLQGMQLTGYVSADDTVTVVLRNGTAGAIDLASGTLRIGAWRH